MKERTGRTVGRKMRGIAWLLAISVVIVSFSTMTGGAVAQPDVPIEIEVPDQAQAGEETSISASATAPELRTNVEGDMTVSLYVDGQLVATETVTVEDGETTEVEFDQTFDSEGTYDVEVEAEISLRAQTFSNSVSATVPVTEAPTSRTALEGPAFPVPSSLQGDVEEYRDNAPPGVDLGPRAFVLATEDQVYLVFTRNVPEKGIASVSGVSVDREFRSDGRSYGVIAADSVSFETTGSETTVREVSSSPDQFDHELVRIQSTHRQLSTLIAPDEADYTLATSSGVLVDDPTGVGDLFEEPGAAARSLSITPSADGLDKTTGDVIDSLLGEQPRVYTFDFEVKFWADTESTVDAIVLTPGSEAREFVAARDEHDVIQTDSSSPVLYVVNDEREYQQYDDIGAVSRQSDDGDLVSIEADLFGKKISIQETLEASTGCGDDTVEVQTPQGPACVNVVHDTLVYGGAAWTSLPEDRDDVLLVAGLSSEYLDQPSEQLQGSYRIDGEVITTDRVDESLPDGRILMIHDLERTGSIDFEGLADDARKRIEDRFDSVDSSLQTQATGSEESTEDEVVSADGPGDETAGTGDDSDGTGGTSDGTGDGGSGSDGAEGGGTGDGTGDQASDEDDSSTEELPGFGPGLAVIALGIICILYKREGDIP